MVVSEGDDLGDWDGEFTSSVDLTNEERQRPLLKVLDKNIPVPWMLQVGMKGQLWGTGSEPREYT